MLCVQLGCYMAACKEDMRVKHCQTIGEHASQALPDMPINR